MIPNREGPSTHERKAGRTNYAVLATSALLGYFLGKFLGLQDWGQMLLAVGIVIAYNEIAERSHARSDDEAPK